MAYLQAFAIVVGALTLAAFGLKLNLGHFSRPLKLKLWAGLLLGAALCFGVGGGIARYRISHSARLRVVGIVSNLRVFQGKHGSKTTRFDVKPPDGTIVSLNGSYYGQHLQDGQTVDVTYLEDYGQVLKIKSSKPTAWSAEESDSLLGAELSCWCGGVAAIIAPFLLFLSNRTSELGVN